jgi:FKBP-type peptidyl-prolyl cis-trans isomerase FkpA
MTCKVRRTNLPSGKAASQLFPTMKKFSFVLFAALAAIIVACGGGELTSPNGYKYIKHTNATGKAANIGDYGYVNISVYQDDSLVNSTYQMGRTVPIMVPDFSQVPADQKGVGKANPVADVLALMKVGDSISVEVPIDSLMRQNPNLKDAKRLTYAIVLADVQTKVEYDAAKAKEQEEKMAAAKVYQEQEKVVAAQLGTIVKDYKAGANKDKIKSTPSGLKYLMLEEGKGAQAIAGKGVDVMYYGMLTNGTEFDNSYKRGQPFSFPLGQGQVIKGWDEGIALLKEGGKAVLFVPAELGYGAEANAAIPANSELVFYVDLQKVK